MSSFVQYVVTIVTLNVSIYYIYILVPVGTLVSVQLLSNYNILNY